MIPSYIEIKIFVKRSLLGQLGGNGATAVETFLQLQEILLQEINVYI